LFARSFVQVVIYTYLHPACRAEEVGQGVMTSTGLLKVLPSTQSSKACFFFSIFHFFFTKGLSLPFIHYGTSYPYYATIHNVEEKCCIIWMKIWKKIKINVLHVVDARLHIWMKKFPKKVAYCG